MIKKIRAIYNRALLRPMIYMATNRFLIALILLLLANLLLSGAHIKMYAALLLGVCFVLLAWIAWLRLDGVRLPKLMMKRVNIRKKPVRSYGDMIDYIDEQPVTFDDLDDAEKDVLPSVRPGLRGGLSCAFLHYIM